MPNTAVKLATFFHPFSLRYAYILSAKIQSSKYSKSSEPSSLPDAITFNFEAMYTSQSTVSGVKNSCTVLLSDIRSTPKKRNTFCQFLEVFFIHVFFSVVVAAQYLLSC